MKSMVLHCNTKNCSLYGERHITQGV